MGEADYLAEGDWNAACSMCGAKRKASTLVKNWQGMWRCPAHNEPRHPQDFVRAVADVQTPPWTQPGSDSFVYGDFLITDTSNIQLGPLIYLLTSSDSQPLTTDT